jgi:hypothetical protein
LVSTSLVLLGCPLKKPGEAVDAAPDASASAVVEAGPVAANDATVTHYPDQTPGANETLTVHTAAHARTEASATGGTLVAQLHPGTDTQKLAEHNGFELVLFTDPNNPAQKLEGWVIHTSFVAVPVTHLDGGIVAEGGAPPVAVDAGACKPLDLKKSGTACPAGYTTCGAACRLQCSKDADCCISGATCTGGTCLGKGGQPCAH